MILVRVRCYRCRRVLATVEQPPEDWSASFQFVRCRKCDIPDPRRFVHVLVTREGGMSMTGVIPWRLLRRHIAQAQRSGTPQDFYPRVDDSRRADDVS